MRKAIIAALAALTIPQFANAAGFSYQDLGSISDDPACVSQGRETFQFYKGEVGAGKVDSSTWVVVMFDITDSEFDAIITCAYGPNGPTRATLVVHGGDGTDDGHGKRISERIKAIWESFD